MWNPDVSHGDGDTPVHRLPAPHGARTTRSWKRSACPTWVAQRLWTGSSAVPRRCRACCSCCAPWPRRRGGAGAGSLDTATVRRCRRDGGGPRLHVVALRACRTRPAQSALLLPWVGLPWMVGLTARALRSGGWRHPALFALVVALVGSTNAVALILVGVGPAAVGGVGARGRSGCDGVAPCRRRSKIGVLSAAVSLWWASGLVVEGAYGMDILRYTESIPTVARTSLASETLRGLGYWFFYGVDKLGLYLPMAGPYMTSLWLLAVSFAVPAVAFLAAFVRAMARARLLRRAGRGGHDPVGGGPPVVGPLPAREPGEDGRHRLDGRAGAAQHQPGHTARRARHRRAPRGRCRRAAASLEGRGRDRGRGGGRASWPPTSRRCGRASSSRPTCRVPSRSRRTGNRPRTISTSQPGADQTRVPARARHRLLDLPVGHHPRAGAPRSHDPSRGRPRSRPLRLARDRRTCSTPSTTTIQDDTFNPSAVAPVLRLMSAGDLVVQSDLAYEHYNTPRPRALWQKLDPPPPGSRRPVGFGNPAVTAAPPVKYPLIDETELGLPHDAPYPQPVTVFSVPGARPILRAEGATTPAAARRRRRGLDRRRRCRPARRSGDRALLAVVRRTQPRLRARAGGRCGPGGDRHQPQAGRAVRHGGRQRRLHRDRRRRSRSCPTTATPDSRSSPPRPATTNQTVAEQLGVKSVQASNYGNPITYVPEDRPDQALDGNLRTTWTVAAFDNPVGPVPPGRAGPSAHHRPRQPRPAPVRAAQSLDHARHASLRRWASRHGEARSRRRGPRPGQTVTFPTRTFTTLRITIDATNTGIEKSYNGQVRCRVRRGAHPRATGPRGAAHARGPPRPRRGRRRRRTGSPIIMTRETASPVPPATDPEIDIARTFTLPTTRTFSVSGTAELSALVPDDVLDRLLGTTVPGIRAAYSSGRLPGDVVGPDLGDARRQPGHGVEPRPRTPGRQLARVRPGAPDHLRPPVDGDRDRR